MIHNLAFGVAGTAWGFLITFAGPVWPGVLLIGVGLVILARFLLWPWVKALAFTVGAALPVVALLTFLFHPVIFDWWHRTEFDAAIWKARPPATDYMWPPRLCMVDDLLAHHDLHGRGHSEVLSLLGEPDRTNWDTDGQLVYHLGPERGLFRIDSEWLVITMAADGTVRDYRLARD